MIGKITHSMDSPRFAVGLALFGAFGVGLALMSPTLFILGSFICYAAALGTFVRYWDDLRPFALLRLPAPKLDVIIVIVMLTVEVAAPTYLLLRSYYWTPNVSFQKFALFWIRGEQDTYQLGIVAKLFDEEGESFKVKNLVFAGNKSTWIPRGSYHIRSYAQYPNQLDMIIDDELKANNIKYFSRLLPFIFEMTIDGGKTMGIDLIGNWKLYLDKYTMNVDPRGYAVYDDPISINEWQDLLKPQSKIDIENLTYTPLLAN